MNNILTRGETAEKGELCFFDWVDWIPDMRLEQLHKVLVKTAHVLSGVTWIPLSWC